MTRKEQVRKHLEEERKQKGLDFSDWPPEWRTLLDFFAMTYGTYNFAKTQEYREDFGEYNPYTGEYEVPWE